MDATPNTATPVLADMFRRLASLGLTILVAWGCSLIWGFGELTIAHGLLYTLYGNVGLVQWQGPLHWTPQQGFVAMALGPTLLGLLLWHNWRGLVSGAIAFVVSLLTPIIWWTNTAIAFTIASSLPELSDYDIGEKALTSWGPYLIAQGFVTALVITIVILINTRRSPQRNRNLKNGLKVGLLVVLASCLGTIVAQQIALSLWYDFIRFTFTNDPRLMSLGWFGMAYAEDAMFFFLWQIPPLLWGSVVYFSHTTEPRPGLTEFFTLGLLVIITLLLPFILFNYVPLQ